MRLRNLFEAMEEIHEIGFPEGTNIWLKPPIKMYYVNGPTAYILGRDEPEQDYAAWMLLAIKVEKGIGDRIILPDDLSRYGFVTKWYSEPSLEEIHHFIRLWERASARWKA